MSQRGIGASWPRGFLRGEVIIHGGEVEVPLVRESVLLSEKNKNNMYSHISSYIISENIVQQLANGESVEIRAIVFGKEVRHSLQKSAINGLKSFL